MIDERTRPLTVVGNPLVRPEDLGFSRLYLDFLAGKSPAVDFFLAYEVLRGAYFSVSTKEENESILLWSLCTMLDKDLPDIEEVVILIDHEYMHHLLYCLEGEWKSSSYDNIAADVEDWIFLKEECE